VAELPAGEQDYFERKSGHLFDGDMGDLLGTIAKALSAFSNSGSGHLILGVAVTWMTAAGHGVTALGRGVWIGAGEGDEQGTGGSRGERRRCWRDRTPTVIRPSSYKSNSGDPEQG
jgi:hypothetical protein